MSPSAGTDRYRRESVEMAKTMADVLREEGRREGRQEGRREGVRQMLLRQLRSRFGELPSDVVQAVESTEDDERLQFWLDRGLTARSLDEMEIGPSA